MIEPQDSDFAQEWLQHLLHVEGALYVLTRGFGVPTYDFDFERAYRCSHPVFLPPEIEVAARVGPIADYSAFSAALAPLGLRLVNSPGASRRANDLREWYPRLAELTARSLWFDGPPDLARVERELGYPVFVKTVQQTLRHRREFSVVHDRGALERAVAAYGADPVLGSHVLVFREFLELAPLPFPPSHPDRISGGKEIRSFWWKGRLVGDGSYWARDGAWEAPARERLRALELGEEAVRRLDVPFVVADLAQRTDGSWVVIESNDAQECGYAGIDPRSLWLAVMETERAS